MEGNTLIIYFIMSGKSCLKTCIVINKFVKKVKLNVNGITQVVKRKRFDNNCFVIYLSYSFAQKNEVRLEPGTICMMMGHTGAGKTTLFRILCGDKDVGKVAGSIYLDGKGNF